MQSRIKTHRKGLIVATQQHLSARRVQAVPPSILSCCQWREQLGWPPSTLPDSLLSSSDCRQSRQNGARSRTVRTCDAILTPPEKEQRNTPEIPSHLTGSVRFLSQPSHNPHRPTRKRQEEEESVPERCVFVRSVCPPRVRCPARSQSDLSPVRAHSVRFCQTLVRFHRCLNLPRASPFRTAAIAACPIVLSALYIRACHSTRMRALGREEHSCCHCCLLLRLLCRQEAIHRHSKERGEGFGISEVLDGTPGGPILEGERGS